MSLLFWSSFAIASTIWQTNATKRVKTYYGTTSHSRIFNTTIKIYEKPIGHFHTFKMVIKYSNIPYATMLHNNSNNICKIISICLVLHVSLFFLLFFNLTRQSIFSLFKVLEQHEFFIQSRVPETRIACSLWHSIENNI